MKILFEICHPAHVHYFRNLINELNKKGHETLILAQNRGIIPELLKSYRLPHYLFNNLPKNIRTTSWRSHYRCPATWCQQEEKRERNRTHFRGRRQFLGLKYFRQRWQLSGASWLSGWSSVFCYRYWRGLGVNPIPLGSTNWTGRVLT